MRLPAIVVAAGLLSAACGALPPPFPRHAYYPLPSSPATATLAQVLGRAAGAAGDDPERYSFALVRTRKVFALSAPEAIFYFSDGLARLPGPQIDALVAQAVAHEVLGHDGERRALSLGVSAGFTVLGVLIPGLGLADFLVNPLIVRAFSRDQHLAADRRAVEIVRSMGHERPRRSMTEALEAAASVNGPRRGGLLALEPDLETRLVALQPLEPAAGLATHAPAR